MFRKITFFLFVSIDEHYDQPNTTLLIPSGQYDSIEKFLQILNETIDKYKLNENIKLTVKNGQVLIWTNLFVIVPLEIGKILGFTTKLVINGLNTSKGVYAYSNLPINLSALKPLTMKIYTDIIKPRRINNLFEPLLRQVTVLNDKYSNLEEKIFREIEYVPVQQSYINKIRILIKTELNQFFPFEIAQGIVVNLHFKL